MADTRVITAHVPVELAEQIDKYAAELDRSRGWIVKQALMRWLSREEEKNRLALEVTEDGKKGGTPDREVGPSIESPMAGKPTSESKPPRKGG